MSYASQLTNKLIIEFGLQKAELIIKEMHERISKEKANARSNPRSETIIKWI